MKAFQVQGFDQAPALVEVAEPTPAKGEALLRIHACSLNFADILMTTGKYQDTPALPFTLGLEMAGEVVALGPETGGPAVGTRVAIYAGQGGLAEYGCFPVDRLVPLPDAMSYEDAAAFQIAYGTSHVVLDHRARMQPGETLLVLGAAGGVGLTAVEIGKLMGATVIACARGQDKLEIARAAGADHLIDAKIADIRAEVKALGGADVVYDPVGGEQWEAAFRACKPEARLIPIGFASGDVPQIPANHVMVKNLTILGLYYGAYRNFAPKVLTDSMTQLFKWYEDGALKPHVSHVLPLDRADEALELLRSRKSTGKVVVTP